MVEDEVTLVISRYGDKWQVFTEDFCGKQRVCTDKDSVLAFVLEQMEGLERA